MTVFVGFIGGISCQAPSEILHEMNKNTASGFMRDSSSTSNSEIKNSNLRSLKMIYISLVEKKNEYK